MSGPDNVDQLVSGMSQLMPMVAGIDLPVFCFVVIFCEFF